MQIGLPDVRCNTRARFKMASVNNDKVFILKRTVMACASFVVVSALAPFNHYPAYVSSSSVPDVSQLALSSTARPPTTTAPYEHYCKGRPDNYSAVEPGTKCRRYFRCHSPRIGQKSPSIYLCPGKLVFNGQKCVHTSEYQCQNATQFIQSPTQAPVDTKVDTKALEVSFCNLNLQPKRKT